MKQYPDRCTVWRISVISFALGLTCACATMEGLSQRSYDPPSGRGPIVILISGASGPDQYRSYAAEVARLGYYAVLVDGNETNPADPRVMGKSVLKRVIGKAQKSPNALPGKVTVIGFSMGGGGALSYATQMPDLVSAVIAYFPMTMHVQHMPTFAAGFKVPILVLAGGKDTYMNCCLIESMKDMEAAAKKGTAPFELVVYPEARHAFIWANVPEVYRAEDSADAWQRTIKILGQYHPLR